MGCCERLGLQTIFGDLEREIMAELEDLFGSEDEQDDEQQQHQRLDGNLEDLEDEDVRPAQQQRKSALDSSDDEDQQQENDQRNARPLGPPMEVGHRRVLTMVLCGLQAPLMPWSSRRLRPHCCPCHPKTACGSCALPTSWGYSRGPSIQPLSRQRRRHS